MAPDAQLGRWPIGEPAMTTPPTPVEVEKFARLFCAEAGIDPDCHHTWADEITGHESMLGWQRYRGVALTHICMARAYEKMRAGE